MPQVGRRYCSDMRSSTFNRTTKESASRSRTGAERQRAIVDGIWSVVTVRTALYEVSSAGSLKERPILPGFFWPTFAFRTKGINFHGLFLRPMSQVFSQGCVTSHIIGA